MGCRRCFRSRRVSTYCGRGSTATRSLWLSGTLMRHIVDLCLRGRGQSLQYPGWSTSACHDGRCSCAQVRPPWCQYEGHMPRLG